MCRALRTAGRRAVVTTVAAFLVAATVAPGTGRALDRATTRKVQPAVVQLGPVYTVKDADTGKQVMRVFGWGSGTILDRAGNILTNEHVTDVEDLREELAAEGATVLTGVVAVFMTKRTDEPPVPCGSPT